MWPILSAINKATYGCAKVFISLLKCFTLNEYTHKDSFGFANDVTNQNSNRFMASLDVDSPFANVVLDETIKICGMSCLNLKFQLLVLTKKKCLKCFH